MPAREFPAVDMKSQRAPRDARVMKNPLAFGAAIRTDGSKKNCDEFPLVPASSGRLCRDPDRSSGLTSAMLMALVEEQLTPWGPFERGAITFLFRRPRQPAD